MTFGRPSREEIQARRTAEREANLRALMTPARTLHTASMERIGGIVHAIAKTAPQRNPRLLRLARNAPCLLLVPGCCNHRTDTTVACHSNQAAHGKAGARKADDHWSVSGCAPCHEWLDRGRAPQAQKEAAFADAMGRQIIAWRHIASDQSRPQADRRAAEWALERHEQ